VRNNIDCLVQCDKQATWQEETHGTVFLFGVPVDYYTNFTPVLPLFQRTRRN